jgi:hypothetical protein
LTDPLEQKNILSQQETLQCSKEKFLIAHFLFVHHHRSYKCDRLTKNLSLVTNLKLQSLEAGVLEDQHHVVVQELMIDQALMGQTYQC